MVYIAECKHDDRSIERECRCLREPSSVSEAYFGEPSIFGPGVIGFIKNYLVKQGKGG